MKMLSMIALSVSLLASVSSKSFADEVKIATVDVQKALQTSESGKKALSQLEKEFNDKKKQLQSEEASIKKMGEEFRKQSLALSDEARNKKQGELQERIMKFQSTTARSQADIQQRQLDLTQPLLIKLRSIVNEMAKKKGYSLVLEKNENTVLFSQEKDDLTGDVVTAMNSGKSS